MGKSPVELGGLYCKSGSRQPVWRVAGFIRHAPRPHVKLTRVDAPGTQITMSVAALIDPRIYRRVPE